MDELKKIEAQHIQNGLTNSLAKLSDSIYNEFRTFEFKSEKMTPVKELKYLGVIFDNRLSFDSQINNLKN